MLVSKPMVTVNEWVIHFAEVMPRAKQDKSDDNVPSHVKMQKYSKMHPGTNAILAKEVSMM